MAPPADDLEQSWLRTELHAVAEEEKHPFVEALRRERKGQVFIARWNDWMRSCASDPSCEPDNPSKRCELHEVMALCNYYLDVVEREWNVICDWYHLPPEKLAGESHTGRLFERYEYTLPGLDKYGYGTSMSQED